MQISGAKCYSMIDVVTLTMNNETELLATLNSLACSIDSIGNIFVIYDGFKPNFEIKTINEAVLEKLKLHEGPAAGIYPAMNVALQYVQNDFIFINSGDLVVGNPFDEINDQERPIMISCKAADEKYGLRNIKPSKLLFKFNHNSIVFPIGFQEKYNLSYKIAADFEIFTKLCKRYKWPVFVNTSGYILYDLNGVSSVLKSSRDLEYSQISIRANKPILAAYYFSKYLLNKLIGYA